MISCTNSLILSQSNEMKGSAHLKYQLPFRQSGAQEIAAWFLCSSSISSLLEFHSLSEINLLQRSSAFCVVGAG